MKIRSRKFFNVKIFNSNIIIVSFFTYISVFIFAIEYDLIIFKLMFLLMVAFYFYIAVVIFISQRKLPGSSRFNYIYPCSVIEIHVDTKNKRKRSLFIRFCKETLLYAKKHKYKEVLFITWIFKKSNLEKYFSNSIVFLKPNLIDKIYGFVLMKLYKVKNKNTSNLIKAKVNVQLLNEEKIKGMKV